MLEFSGFFDFQVNGYAGVDFQQGSVSLEDIQRAVKKLREDGVDGVLVALITDRIESIAAKLERFEWCRWKDPLVREVIRGYHIEGPYLSEQPGYCGAHQAELMKDPDWTEFNRLWEVSNNNIRLVTVAPERKGSALFIEKVVEQGVHVALGHTDASRAEIRDAVSAGARFVTHLGNGVPAQLPRHDNVIQRLLAEDELRYCLIPDGVHLPEFVLRNFIRCAGWERVLFTTDCMAAAGANAGLYTLLNLRLEVGADRVVRLPGKPGFAGSALTMAEACDNLVKWAGVERDVAFEKCSSESHRLFMASA